MLTVAVVLVVIAAVAVATMVPTAAAIAAPAALVGQVAAIGWQQQCRRYTPAMLIKLLLRHFVLLLNWQQLPIVAARRAAGDAAGLQMAIGLQLWVRSARG